MVLAAWELLFVSAVMQTGLALPMAYYFHRATTIGLPANLIVIPLTQLMMPAAILALSIGYISPWLAKVPVLATSLALDGITGTIRGLGGLHLADLRVPMPGILMMALAATSALCLAIWTARRRMPHYCVPDRRALPGFRALSTAVAAPANFVPESSKSRQSMSEKEIRCSWSHQVARHF